MRWIAQLLLIYTFLSFPIGANADMRRGIENYQAIMAGEKRIEKLSQEEAQEVLWVLQAIEKRGSAGGCSGGIASRIDGEFEGWDGETVFKLINGQVWQQSSYSYRYRYAYNPEVVIFPSGGRCKLKVDGMDSTIFVRRLR